MKDENPGLTTYKEIAYKALTWLALFPIAYYLIWLATATVDFEVYNTWQLEHFAIGARVVMAMMFCALWVVLCAMQIYNWVFYVKRNHKE